MPVRSRWRTSPGELVGAAPFTRIGVVGEGAAVDRCGGGRQRGAAEGDGAAASGVRVAEVAVERDRARAGRLHPGGRVDGQVVADLQSDVAAGEHDDVRANGKILARRV